MKQIEHLPAVVLCATLVLPCLTFRPRETRPRRTRPPGAAGCKANQASGAARGVPPAVRSSARAASPVRLLNIIAEAPFGESPGSQSREPQSKKTNRSARMRSSFVESFTPAFNSALD